jgi:DNA-directed RNA polymerase sigma subunit (sigma70/sigma32)
LEKRNKDQKRITREDVAFLLKLVAKGQRLNYFHLTDNGKAILEMALHDQMPLPKIAKTLLLSEERVRQIYKREMRLLGFYIDKAYSNYREYTDLKKENALLYESIKSLTKENNSQEKKPFDKNSIDHRRAS